MKELDVSAPGETPHTTVLFVDICESTSLYEQLGNDRALEIVSAAFLHLTRVITKNGGRVVRTMGDEVLAAFALPEHACKAAYEMQKAIHLDPMLSVVGLSLRIGLHTGEVIERSEELHGFVVEVAAKATQLAAADQIVATREALCSLPSSAQVPSRPLGLISVKKGATAVEFREVLWARRDGTGKGSKGMQDTMIQTLGGLQQNPVRLLLRRGDEQWQVSVENEPFSIGRAGSNDLIVLHKNVSREHASVHFRRSACILTDRSTNGLYVIPQDSTPIFVHRTEVTLSGRGGIHLGRKIDDEIACRLGYELESAP